MGSVTCLECKSEIPEGAQLCPDCGFNFAEAPPVNCPECSTTVVFAGGLCPECGFPYDALDELLLEAEQQRTGASRQFGTQNEHPSAAAPAAQLAGLASFSRDVAGESHLSLNDVIATLSSYLDDLKQSNCSALDELSAGVERLLANAEKLKLENESALQGMQDVTRNFSSEVKSVLEGISSVKEAAGQGKGEASGGGEKVSGTVDYIFYISLAMLLFTALNIAVTAYVAKLVR